MRSCTSRATFVDASMQRERQAVAWFIGHSQDVVNVHVVVREFDYGSLVFILPGHGNDARRGVGQSRTEGFRSASPRDHGKLLFVEFSLGERGKNEILGPRVAEEALLWVYSRVELGDGDGGLCNGWTVNDKAIFRSRQV